VDRLKDFKKKWQILIAITPILLVIIILKFVFHFLGWEIISLNALFVSMIAATTFLIGFLITGVLSDYKESEKIPGDLATSLEAIYDEAYILNRNKRSAVTEEFMEFYQALLLSIRSWFYKKERTQNLMFKLSTMNDYFAQFEPLTQANFIARMKQEQTNVRRMINRVHTIRETTFIQSGYAVVEALAILLIFGLLILKFEPFYESMFIVGLAVFFILYMISLIKDLDDPFDYAQGGDDGNEVSLKPLNDLIDRIGTKERPEQGPDGPPRT
jgi:hypothetical protein